MADITYIQTDEGFLQLAFILDACSRKLVGWLMASHLRTQLLADALEMAVWRRNPGAGVPVRTSTGGKLSVLDR